MFVEVVKTIEKQGENVIFRNICQNGRISEGKTPSDVIIMIYWTSGNT